MLVRSTCLRASREARPHTPSNAAEVRLKVAKEVKAKEAEGRTKAPNPILVNKASAPAASKARTSHRSFEETHLLALHSKSIAGSHTESSWLSLHNSVPLRHSSLAFWALKAASVRISLVSEKHSPAATPKAGSSQQTTRVNSQPLVAAFSTQAVSVAVALGVARSGLEDPRGVGLSSPLSILRAKHGSLHVTACTDSGTANASPLRLGAFSVLEALSQVARDEIEHKRITRVITHEVDDNGAVRTLCRRSSDLKQGDCVWAIIGLMLFLSHEPHGRKILREAGVADYDLAVSRVLADFGHSEITRRFRLQEATTAAYRNLPPPTENEVDEVLRRVQEQEVEETDSDATTVSVRKEKGKRKRSPLQAPASHEVAASWAHALTLSNQIHVLLMLVASSAAAARSAASTTLQRQYSANPNLLMEAVSQDSAVSSRESLRCLFRQPENEVPRIVVWRTRSASGVLSQHRGIARSLDDLQQSMFCFGKLAKWSTPHLKIVNVQAYHVRSSDTVSKPVPGFTEACKRINEEEGMAKGKRDAERIDRLKCLRKGDTTSQALTGISRSELVLAMRLVVSRSAVQAGRRLAETAKSAQVETPVASQYALPIRTHVPNLY